MIGQAKIQVTLTVSLLIGPMRFEVRFCNFKIANVSSSHLCEEGKTDNRDLGKDSWHISCELLFETFLRGAQYGN
jgi:hypothetical protein